MTVQPLANRVDIEDVTEMYRDGSLGPDTRVELLDGVLTEMGPIGAPHAGTVMRVDRTLRGAVTQSVAVWVQNALVLDDVTLLQPDVAILRSRADDYTRDLPTGRDALLVVEVADSSLPYDRDRKARRYLDADVPEVWVVDISHRQVLTFSLDERGDLTVEVLTDGDVIRSAGLADAGVRVADLLPPVD